MRDTKDKLSFAGWNTEEYWKKQKRLLGTSHSMYKEPLGRAFDWFTDVQQDWYIYSHIMGLIVAGKLGDREGSIEKAIDIIDTYIEMPAWNGQNEDGYAYNGDKTAAITFRAHAMAYHILEKELGPERRKKLLEKLTYQGNQFMTMALLRGHGWGGSIVQDHGWRAMFAFGAGALYLVDDIPDAKIWVRYIIPRLERSVNAMPRDGVISPASYMTPCLYLHELMHYREALLARTGTDILDQPHFREIPVFMIKMMRKDDATIFCGPHAMRVWNGGEMLCNRLAQKYKDPLCAWLHQRLANIPEPKCAHFDYSDGHYRGIIWGFFTYDPTIKPLAPVHKKQRFSYFADTGLVAYRNDSTGVTFSTICGAWPSYSSYRQLTCASDRLKLATVDGDFNLYLGTSPMIIRAEGAYKPHTYLGNCMSVDGEGQYGSIGYPCSVSNWDYRGEHIEKASWDEKTGTGLVRLNLKASYPENIGMTHYTRDFIITPERKLICRDRVVFDKPRTLTWYFHNNRSVGLKLDDKLRCTIGKKPKLLITPHTEDAELTAKIEETPVVWAYYSHSNWDPYDQVVYETKEKVSSIIIDFEFTW